MTTAVWDEAQAATRPRPEPKRDRYGRYLIKGKPYTRATTWASTVDDRYNLERWQQRMVAVGLVARQDLYAAVAATPIDDKAKLGKLCEAAIEAAKGSAGANLGTALHTFTERIDSGEELVVPAPWDADVAAYRATLGEAGVEIIAGLIERIVVRHDLGVAGTFDRGLLIPSRSAHPIIGDLKTGAFLDWGAIAIQLALYANADELYDQATDSLTAAPAFDKEVGVVIHLPVGQATCTLYEVDIAAGWEMAQVCGTVRGWRKRKDLADRLEAKPRPPSAPPTAERLGWLRGRVADIAAIDEARDLLAAHWPAGVPTLRQGGLLDAQVDTLAGLCTWVETKFDIPFADPDPATVVAAPPAAPAVAMAEPAPVVAAPPPLSDPQVKAMVARLRPLLQAGRLAPVEAIAKAEAIPSVVSGEVTDAQFQVLDAAVSLVEAEFEPHIVTGLHADDPAAFVASVAGLLAGDVCLDIRADNTVGVGPNPNLKETNR